MKTPQFSLDEVVEYIVKIMNIARQSLEDMTNVHTITHHIEQNIENQIVEIYEDNKLIQTNTYQELLEDIKNG